jgi:hypothetical protein
VATLGVHGADFDALYAHADAELYARKAQRGGGRRARPAVAPPDVAHRPAVA